MCEKNTCSVWSNGYFVRVAAWADSAFPEGAFRFAAEIREAAERVERNRRYRWAMSQIPPMNPVGQLIIQKVEGFGFVKLSGDIEGLTPRQARRLARHIERVARVAEEALFSSRAAMHSTLDEFWSTYYENQQFYA